MYSSEQLLLAQAMLAGQLKARAIQLSEAEQIKFLFARKAFVTARHCGRIVDGLLLSAEQRVLNGYPTRGRNGVELQANEYQHNRPAVHQAYDFERTCTRCHSRFFVMPNGKQVPATTMVCFDGEQHRNFHVHDQVSASALQRFPSTPKVNKSNCHLSSEMLALDLEMIQTVSGQTVGRITLVSCTEAVLLDIVVKQTDRILDPMTKYSGLTIESFKTAKWTLEAARMAFLNELNERTILVGHGLANDLRVLGVVHERVIDTSVIYTHRGRRPALRNLTKNVLGYHIQQGDGHCSAEDAVASMRLAIHGLNHPEILAPQYHNLHNVV
ncbi:unnamed protein product [Caenorhabditis sp. 36 PRJEB53466]|nr:unnamed protein product [Caenorhabditis sp. 36 PRJEB53466]